MFLVTLGITLFQLSGKKKGKGEDSPYGIALLLLSLAMDGVTGTIQDKIKADKTKVKPTVHESMFYTNMAAVLILAVAVAVTGQGISGVQYCIENPEIIQDLALFSLTSAFGQNFIFLTLTYFDALILSTVTTTRKFFTILVSVVLYGHELNRNQWLSVLLVFLGLMGEIYEGYEKKKKAQQAKLQAKLQEKAK